MTKKFLFSISIILLLVSFSVPSAHSTELDEFERFQIWADERDIELVGVNKNSYDLYYDGYVPETDYVDWRQVPRVLIAANELYKIPENVIQVMYGKTIYFSTEYGRGYAVLGSFSDHGILTGLNKGIILEQNINSYTIIHELGHIVDYHGIQGYYDDKHIFDHASDERSSVFQVDVEYYPHSDNPPEGYITVYSTANNAENFAEHFAQYVQYPNEYRERILADPLLSEEYEFLRNYIFVGLEFE